MEQENAAVAKKERIEDVLEDCLDSFVYEGEMGFCDRSKIENVLDIIAFYQDALKRVLKGKEIEASM